MKNSCRILVTVATYNEIENLPALVEEIFRHAPHVDLLVIDDNSPDGTGQWCDQRAREDSRVSCLHRSGKLGLGSALLEGLRRAVAEQYDLVVHMDGDQSHPPRFLPQLLDRMLATDPPECDVLIGSRYVPGGAVENWPWWRRWMSYAVNAYCRLLLRLPVRDCSGGFRGYRVERLKRLDLSAIHAQGYAVLEELLWFLHRDGARLAEMPITFVNRRHGVSKISAREAVSVLVTIPRLVFKSVPRAVDSRVNDE